MGEDAKDRENGKIIESWNFATFALLREVNKPFFPLEGQTFHVRNNFLSRCISNSYDSKKAATEWDCTRREIGLSVMVFSGYDFDDLCSGHIPFTDELLSYTDLLVDGFFDERNPETRRNWAGSTNQRFHFLTDFYKPGIELDGRFSHGFELRFYSDGTLTSNGFPMEFESLK